MKDDKMYISVIFHLKWSKWFSIVFQIHMWINKIEHTGTGICNAIFSHQGLHWQRCAKIEQKDVLGYFLIQNTIALLEITNFWC